MRVDFHPATDETLRFHRLLALWGRPGSSRAANEPRSRVDVQLAGRCEAIQSEFPMFDQLAVSNFDLDGYELA